VIERIVKHLAEQDWRVLVVKVDHCRPWTVAEGDSDRLLLDLWLLLIHFLISIVHGQEIVDRRLYLLGPIRWRVEVLAVLSRLVRVCIQTLLGLAIGLAPPLKIRLAEIDHRSRWISLRCVICLHLDG
jgi:hypothetical protein